MHQPRLINNYMASSQKVTNQRKLVVERPYGESLIFIEALLKVNEKEKKEDKKQQENLQVHQ